MSSKIQIYPWKVKKIITIENVPKNGLSGAHRAYWKMKPGEQGLGIWWEPWQRRRSWGHNASNLVLNGPSWSPLSLGSLSNWAFYHFFRWLGTSTHDWEDASKETIKGSIAERHQGMGKYTPLRTQCNWIPGPGLLINANANREKTESLNCTLFRERAVWEECGLTFPHLQPPPTISTSRLYNKWEEKQPSILEFSFIPVGRSAVPDASLFSAWCLHCSLAT